MFNYSITISDDTIIHLFNSIFFIKKLHKETIHNLSISSLDPY